MPEPIGPGSLKCVVCVPANRSLRDNIEAALSDRVKPHNVSLLSDGTLLVYTEASPDRVRDWLIDALTERESVFVCEFERWSSRGEAADRDWLRMRGH